MSVEAQPVDRLAEATGGKLRWDDPWMTDYEQGWQDFQLGARVEVRASGNIWAKGTVVETHLTNGCAIVVKTDEVVHDDLDNYKGRGMTVMVCQNSRRGILSNIRKIDERPRPIEVFPLRFRELKNKSAELLREWHELFRELCS